MSDITERQNLVREAIDEAGGADSVRELFGLKARQSVYEWIERGEVPADKAPALAAATKNKKTVQQLCPRVPWEQAADLIRGPATPEATAT